MKTNRPKKNSMEYDPVMEAILRDKNRPKSLRERQKRERRESNPLSEKAAVFLCAN